MSKMLINIIFASISTILIVSLLSYAVDSLPSVIRIGGLFTAEEEEQELAFRFAIDRINNEQILPKTNLVAVAERISLFDSFYAHQKACGLLRNNVIAIFGPLDSITSMQVQSICDELEIPHIETRIDIEAKRSEMSMSINLYPLSSVMVNIYIELVKTWQWKTFAIVYEENWGVLKYTPFFKQSFADNWNVTIYQLLDEEPYRNVFKKIKTNQQFNILLDVRHDNMLEVLKHAQQAGTLTEDYHYCITSMNLHTFDLSEYTVSGAKLTSFKIVNESSYDHIALRNEWNIYASRIGRHNFLTPPKHLRAESALIYDGIKLLAYSLKELDTISDVNEVTCETENQWTDGSSLINYMKQFGGIERINGNITVLKSIFGITDLIKFDNFGFRSNFKLEIIANVNNGYETCGYWLGDKIVKHNEIWDKYFKIALWNNEIIYITTAKNEPFFMEKESKEELTGNDKYEGYVVDLVDKLAEKFGFKYVIRIARDGNYGDNASGVWNGMIGEILNGTADIAVADLTITQERERVVDFTYPFMTTGITILYKKPKDKVTSFWTFLLPFSSKVWNYIVITCVVVSAILFFVGRFTPYEWQNPHPCRHDNQILENVLKSRNSLWVAIGSLMQQGCDIAPRALSTRLISTAWNFFTLIIIASYTANLATFLTIERIPYPFENVDGLANQTKIKYGCKRGGATHWFFQNSKIPTYKKINEFMNKNPDVFLGNEKDNERVEREGGKYAVFVESARNEYITQRDCNLTQIGSPLDNKGYGIATKRGDKRRTEFSEEIVNLQEKGELQNLKNKWWTQKRGGGACVSKPTSQSPRLGISHVGGVFIVLIVGSVIAFLIAIIEFIYKMYTTKHKDSSFVSAMLSEIIFSLSCQSKTKIVKKKNQNDVTVAKNNLSANDSKANSMPRFESQFSTYI